VSPEVFTSDDDGYCAERGTEWDVAAGMEEVARLGVDSCPEGAITLDET
jgi:ferredoxin